MDLHALTKRCALAEIERMLGSASHRKSMVDSFDKRGWTPLMYAVNSANVDLALVQLLLDAGADPNMRSRDRIAPGASVLSLALNGGDPAKVRLLIDRGADVRYRRKEGYDALIDAMHGRDIADDSSLLALLKLILERGAPVDGRTAYCESAVRVASNMGRFDAVKMLLDAGADDRELTWTPLMYAIALGTTEEVQACIDAGAPLGVRDSWERTPWLLAIQTGSVDKAQLLLERGVDFEACGRCGKPPLFYALGGRKLEMLRWLLDLGLDIEQNDEFGNTPLIEASECGDLASIDLLLQCGADLNRYVHGTALNHTTSRPVAARLLAAGAHPADLTDEARRQLVGFASDPTEEYLEVTPAEFLRGRYRRFGSTNPEEIREPFWEAMVRSGASAWSASEAHKKHVPAAREPVFCAKRFGQSITFLPDGRVVQIGGEHEDSYDPDFCIYNDVFVHEKNGNLRIFAYPQALFPPTDFHTATLVGNWIYIIGSLGYPEKRRLAETPVFKLNIEDFHIEPMATHGDNPGWIYRHYAYLEGHRIRVTVRNHCVSDGGEQKVEPQCRDYFLDLKSGLWECTVNGSES